MKNLLRVITFSCRAIKIIRCRFKQVLCSKAFNIKFHITELVCLLAFMILFVPCSKYGVGDPPVLGLKWAAVIKYCPQITKRSTRIQFRVVVGLQ